MNRPDELYELCDWVQYKAGWNFNVMDMQDGTYKLAIVIMAVDAYHPETTRSVMHYTAVPEEPPASWQRWLLDRIVKIETHEACEFFMIKGVRPFNPSHEPGEAPYIITERPA